MLSRTSLIALQLLVAVVAIALWHVLTTVPVDSAADQIAPPPARTADSHARRTERDGASYVQLGGDRKGNGRGGGATTVSAAIIRDAGEPIVKRHDV